ncbi:transmembrane protease serine 3 [Oryzias latipes]
MMRNSEDIDAAPELTEPPPEELEPETPQEPEGSHIELVSVTEEDLPAVETPTTLNVSPLDGSAADLQEDTDPPGPVESQPVAASAHSMPVTKVQPFLPDNDVEKSWRSRLFPHRLELLVAACLLLAVAFFFSVGLGVGLSCVGRFRCGSSQKCVASSARCDGAADCPNQEDELGCVRLSGRRSVLQVQRRGEWRTVCADNWNNSLGLSACKQLGYSRYVESSFVPQNSIEEDLQSSLVSLDTTQSDVIKLQSAAAFSESQCSSGMVTTLKCLECGSRPRYQTRVVGGNLSLPGQFPWQASLHFRGEHMCGGSVISPLWIVTAAHCVYGFSNSSLWKVYVGLTEQPIHAAQSLAVRKIVYHARYRSRSLDYDIALMRLDQPLTFNGLVEPICLPNHGEDFQEDTKCWISGWGATEEDGESGHRLLSDVTSSGLRADKRRTSWRTCVSEDRMTHQPALAEHLTCGEATNTSVSKTGPDVNLWDTSGPGGYSRKQVLLVTTVSLRLRKLITSALSSRNGGMFQGMSSCHSNSCSEHNLVWSRFS